MIIREVVMMENKRLKENRVAEMRALEDNGDMVLEGYAVVFDSPATHYGYTEIIDRNAFDGADMKDICMKYNHLDSYPIMARTRGGSLQFEVDDYGMKVRANLPDTTSNRDIYELVKSGVLDKMSFAFTVSEEEYDYDTDTRRITRFDKIFDVSVVDTPFYEDTSVVARSKDSFLEERNIKLAQEVEFNKKKLSLLLSL